MDQNNNQHGLIIIYTGTGKGKTTAGLGLLLRAWGHGLRVGVLQFIKRPNSAYGEAMAAVRLGIPFITLGDGFTWQSKDMGRSRTLAIEAWAKAQEWILSDNFDLVLLDEMTYLFHLQWLDVHEVLSWLKQHKPPHLHIIISGRNAPPVLQEAADLVTEMVEIKHPYKISNLPAQKGIEY